MVDAVLYLSVYIDPFFLRVRTLIFNQARCHKQTTFPSLFSFTARFGLMIKSWEMVCILSMTYVK